LRRRLSGCFGKRQTRKDRKCRVHQSGGLHA
jgi:hypothetical protein